MTATGNHLWRLLAGCHRKITELHAVYYHENWNFDISFETQVGRELSEFLRDFRDGRDFFRTATVGRRLAGSIAIDGKGAASEGARLRWFIVAPEFQRLGIGRRLIREAVGFCRDAGYGGSSLDVQRPRQGPCPL